MDKKSKITIITSVIALAIVAITVTYAYFSARITGLESASTISLTAATLTIDYTEGDENVVVSNIYPREEAWITKTFTLTGKNSTRIPYQIDMYYDIGLNVITNTFPDSYLTYDLRVIRSQYGTAVGEKMAVPINGTGKVKFGRGRFYGYGGREGEHQYELKIYFKDNNLDQNDAQGAVLNGKIYVEDAIVAPDGWKDAPAGTLLGGIKSLYKVAHNDTDSGMTEPGISGTVSDEGLRISHDDYGTTYYFRGAVENNYIVFANMCWRVVRIDGLGNIKLVLYNYNPNSVSNPCATSEDGVENAFARLSSGVYEIPFNNQVNKNTYIGYMYSNNPDSNEYDIAHANDVDSRILSFLKTWYDQKLRTHNDKIADVIWCNDKSLVTNNSFVTVGTGLGTTATSYGAYERQYSSYSLICPAAGNDGKISKFTARDAIYGNAKLYSNNKEYKIGLLTADEMIFAGGMPDDSSNSISYYLDKNASGNNYWSLSPAFFGDVGSSAAFMHLISGTTFLWSGGYMAVRPAISLKSTVAIASGGAGTASNPFVVN